ncbi:MAG: Integrase [Mycobacterium sp.]|jgi:hypothetical protein|nr:Integrase [Mycobacterium sp.]
MKSVRLFDYLHYDGPAWQVVAQDGPELALKDRQAGFAGSVLRSFSAM